MTEQICQNCIFWKLYKDYPSMGDCKFKPENPVPTVTGYFCNKWKPETVRDEEPKEARIVSTKKPFDISEGAETVLASGIRINTVNVQRLLRCTFRQAALVIRDLRGESNEPWSIDE